MISPNRFDKLESNYSSLRQQLAALPGRGGTAAERPQRWHRFVNNSGETIPAFGVLRVTGFADRLYQVDKPNAFGSFGNFPINGHHDVAPGGRGMLTFDFPAFALYDNAATPAAGERWGPVNGSWRLTKNSVGFLVLGDVDGKGAGRMRVVSAIDTTLFGQADAPIDAEQEGVVSIHYFDDDVWTDTDFDLTVRALGDLEEEGRCQLTWDEIDDQWIAVPVLADETTADEFLNTSGETIPPFAFLNITGHDGVRYTATKPDRFGCFGLAAFNGSEEVETGETGTVVWGFPARAAYNSTDTPVVGHSWGPIDGSWLLQKDSVGFVVIGGADSGNMLVQRAVDFSLLGSFDSFVGANEPGDFTVYKYEFSSWTNTPHTITARNISGVSISPGDRCAAQYIPNDDGQFGAAPLECS